ncbi:hypothetical protein O2W15_01215 [Modestobacter sp. VKM Ac-2979]|uniref:hypothetical protein n=1 Tax=unclassified Modestobacter TaxID=2643866 RepID=UPI0022AB5458|nr:MULTISPECIES: hypothetical protein [unclassified Modestobacter]MCZ2810043.1 hypothetical protein [Modestobacter sp. VKM Ac-2979]MCZ2844674.1 hypothetical protein [Modestobacter sp. VKM Ac-2980]
MPLAALHTVGPDLAVDLAVDRLAEELGQRPQVVRPVVQECRQQLSGAPAGALPELVERLARHRLRAPVD